MNLSFEFFVWDDPQGPYTWQAQDWPQAQQQICEEFEITPDQIESWQEVKP